jgi:hypothetical protein
MVYMIVHLLGTESFLKICLNSKLVNGLNDTADIVTEHFAQRLVDARRLSFAAYHVS